MLFQESITRDQWTRVLKHVVHIAPLEEYCHNSKFGIFFFLFIVTTGALNIKKIFNTIVLVSTLCLKKLQIFI
jgi:hypothetical protein